MINTIYINGLSLLTSFTKSLYIYSSQIFIISSESIFNSMNLYLLSLGNITLFSSSSILLNENCLSSVGNLYLSSSTSISTINGATITYYGGDLTITNNTSSYINSSLSTIIISERCSTNYSMTIGGTTTPINNYKYIMNIFTTELSSLYATNIEFLSYSGSIYVSGLQQSIDMNGITGGYIKLSTMITNTSNQYIEFSENSTIFDSSSNTFIEISTSKGININKNISLTSGYLKFIFNDGNLNIAQNVNIFTYGTNGDIIFFTNNTKSIIVNSLPVSIHAKHSTSNITINIPIIVN